MTVSTPEQLAAVGTTAAAAVWVDQAAAATAVVTERAAAAATRLLEAYDGWYSPAEIAAMTADLAALSLEAQTAVADAMAEYVAQTVSLLSGAPARTPALGTPLIRNGTPLDLVHERTMKAYRLTMAEVDSEIAAMEAAIAKEAQLLQDDIMLAGRQAELGAMRDLGVTHYRRVLRPELSQSGSCLLCVAASLEVYSIEDLLPIHNGCKCKTMPIIDGTDPAEQLNEEDRRRVYKEARTTDRDELRNLRVKIVEHGELGPVLVADGQKYTGAKQVQDRDIDRTTEQLEETLAQLEQSQERFASDGTRKRIAEIRAELSSRGGSGGSGDDDTAPPTPAGEPDPLDDLALGDRIDAGVTAPHRLSKPPPTYERIAPYVAPADNPGQFFTAKERRTADRLAAAQPRISLLSVQELDKVLPRLDPDRRGPDSVIAGTEIGVEIKGIDARPGETQSSAIKRQLRKARSQARVAVVDGVDESLSRDEAIRGLRGAVGTYGDDFDLIVILLGDGTAVHWRRG